MCFLGDWVRPKKEELKKLVGRVDCLVLNDGEARELTGEAKQGKSRSRKTLERAKELLKGVDGPDAKVWIDAIAWCMGDDDAAACYRSVREALATKPKKSNSDEESKEE